MKNEKLEIKKILYKIKTKLVKSNFIGFIFYISSTYSRLTDFIVNLLSNIEQEYLYVFFDELSKSIDDNKNGHNYDLMTEIYVTFYLILPKSLQIDFDFNYTEQHIGPLSELDQNALFNKQKQEHINNLIGPELSLEEEEQNIKNSIEASKNNVEIDRDEEDLLNELYTN